MTDAVLAALGNPAGDDRRHGPRSRSRKRRKRRNVEKIHLLISFKLGRVPGTSNPPLFTKKLTRSREPGTLDRSAGSWFISTIRFSLVQRNTMSSLFCLGAYDTAGQGDIIPKQVRNASNPKATS